LVLFRAAAETGIDKKTETQNKVLLTCVGLFIFHLGQPL
jgi:hypothetical protein